jgi:antirestriction protein
MVRRVWVGLEGSYAAGRLVGEWVDASDLDGDGVAELLARLQAQDPIEGGEELSIMDAEGWGQVEPKAFPLHELAEVDALLDSRPEAEALAGAHGTSYYGTAQDLEDGLDSVSIYGPYSDVKDYVYGLIDDGAIEIPEHLENYLDIEAMARDYTMDATEVHTDAGVWLVFG